MYCVASVDLPEPDGPMNSVVVPQARPPPSSRSISAMPLSTGCGDTSLCPGGSICGNTDDAAAVDGEVVEALDGGDAAELDDAQPPPGPAVFERQLLEQQDAVAEALQLRVLAGRLIVQQQHRACPCRRSRS